MQAFASRATHIVDIYRPGPSGSVIIRAVGQNVAISPFPLFSTNNGNADSFFGQRDSRSTSHTKGNYARARELRRLAELVRVRGELRVENAMADAVNRVNGPCVINGDLRLLRVIRSGARSDC